MGILNSYIKTPDESKLYTVKYAKWLDASASEVLTGVVTAVSPASIPPLVASAVINALTSIVTVDVSGGLAGQEYSVELEVTTSLGQVKEDCLLFTVLGSCT